MMVVGEVALPAAVVAQLSDLQEQGAHLQQCDPLGPSERRHKGVAACRSELE